jgi:hypothetical protein
MCATMCDDLYTCELYHALRVMFFVFYLLCFTLHCMSYAIEASLRGACIKLYRGSFFSTYAWCRRQSVCVDVVTYSITKYQTSAHWCLGARRLYSLRGSNVFLEIWRTKVASLKDIAAILAASFDGF